MPTPNQKLRTADSVVDFFRMCQYIFEGITYKKSQPQDFVVKKKRRPVCIFENGIITVINLSTSFIKRVLHKGEERNDICPRNLYETDVTGNFVKPPTLSMLYGLYAETKLLGATAGEAVLDLPRKGKDNIKTLDHERIDDSVERAKRVAEECGMIITPSNVQIKGKIPWIDPDPNTRQEGIQVYLRTVYDLVTPFVSKRYNLIYNDPIIVDYKLTKNIEECYIDKRKPWQSFPWGCPENMDVFQGTFCSYLSGLPFMYWVFDYYGNPKKGQSPGWKPVPIKTIVTHPEDHEARLRYNEMLQSIRWTVAKLIMWHEEGWPCEPLNPYTGEKNDTCSGCPVLSCEHKNKVIAI